MEILYVVSRTARSQAMPNSFKGRIICLTQQDSENPRRQNDTRCISSVKHEEIIPSTWCSQLVPSTKLSLTLYGGNE